ncbi:MAG: QueT transporter family protein [Clostridia bacterium]|nr:QueT transporter family protein [Clostridia bacterium]MBQ7120935.1 QueT transporter family protein [Clostridia bacterium]
MNNKKVLHLVHGAIIAAFYAAATILISPISYGPVQFRISEALTVLSVFTPAAVPGLTIGCILANLASPYGVWDIIFGSLATLTASVSARKLRHIKFRGLPLLSIIMPVIFNALIVGAEIAFLTPGGSSKLAVFAVSALQVGAGELVVCLLGGIPLYYATQKTKLFK